MIVKGKDKFQNINFWAMVLITVGLVVLFVMFLNLVMTKKELKDELTAEPAVEKSILTIDLTPTPVPRLSGSIYSPIFSSENVVANLRFDKKSNLMSLMMVTLDNLHYCLGGNKIMRWSDCNNTIWSNDIRSLKNTNYETYFLEYDSDNLWGYDIDKNQNLMAWSSKGKLALLLPDKVVLLSLNFPKQGKDEQQPRVLLNEINEFYLPWNVSDFGYPQTFFSNDDKYLFIVNNGVSTSNWIQKLSLSNGVVSTVNVESYSRKLVFPAYEAADLAYWYEWNPERDYGLSVVLNKDGEEKIYPIPEMSSDSFGGRILISPDGKRLCLDGARVGYLIGKFGSKEVEVLSGVGKYGACVKWLNDDEVVVLEDPYLGPINAYYIYNVKTLEKDYLVEGESLRW